MFEDLSTPIWKRYTLPNTEDTDYIAVAVDPDNDRLDTSYDVVYAVPKSIVINAKALKEKVLDDLINMVPTGNNHIDKDIEKAIKHLHKSLEEDLWQDDFNLVCKKGDKAFKEEKDAVKGLMKAMKDKDISIPLFNTLQDAIDTLLDVDQILAQNQIDNASAYPGAKEKEIEKAEKEMAKAQKELDKQHYDKAVDHYMKAWEHAGKAMGKDCGENT